MDDLVYNNRDFTGWDFRSRPEYDFTNRTIVNSCFSQAAPDSQIFSDATCGVTFIGCNLDNVRLPPDSTAQGCSHNRFCVQNDLRDWYVDADGIPVSVVNEKYWQEMGKSVDPADIPALPLTTTDQIADA